MKNRDLYKRFLLAVAIGVVLAIQTGLFALVWFYSYGDDGANYFERGNYVVVALYTLTVFLFNNVFGGFQIGKARTFEIFYSQVLSVLFSNVITYLQLCLIGRWKLMENVVPMAILTVVEITVVLAWCALVRWAHRKLYPPRSMLLVYGDYSPDNLIRKIKMRGDRYIIKEVISIDESFELIEERIQNYENVVLTDVPSEIRNDILKFCFENDIRCYCVPKISDVMIRSAEELHLMDTTLLLFRNVGLTADQQWIKRAFDIVVSIIGIILTSPVMLLIAVCIKLYDGGPVLFTQDRLTKGGDTFRIYKFRSMRMEKESTAYVLTRKNDERITPIGKVIRRTHLDELPQLFNVIKGEMSLVGPRPECPDLAKKYSEMLPQFEYRLKVKAGLTGYAQVYGKYNTTPYDKLKLDLYYIENYSFLLDLKLILLTVKILFQRGNTEGIESWQTTAATAEETREKQRV